MVWEENLSTRHLKVYSLKVWHYEIIRLALPSNNMSEKACDFPVLFLDFSKHFNWRKCLWKGQISAFCVYSVYLKITLSQTWERIAHFLHSIYISVFMKTFPTWFLLNPMRMPCLVKTRLKNEYKLISDWQGTLCGWRFPVKNIIKATWISEMPTNPKLSYFIQIYWQFYGKGHNSDYKCYLCLEFKIKMRRLVCIVC